MRPKENQNMKQYKFKLVQPIADGKYVKLSNLRNAIFLAGPCPREDFADDWRFEAFDILDELGFDGTVITPTNPDYKKFEDASNIDYETMLSLQTNWERIAMHVASAIVFWIPRSAKNPARTTNIEFGEWYKKAGVFVGWPDDAEHNEYLKLKLDEQHKRRYLELKDVLAAAVESLSRPGTMYFTADTHFKQQRTLELSRRPFVSTVEMDLEMISNWNKVVRMSDDVYHAGDFIDPDHVNVLESLLSDLNFKTLHWTYGNYDRKIADKLEAIADAVWKNSGRKIVFYSQGECKVEGPKHSFVIVHEPNEGSFVLPEGSIALYGHIHGRSFAKKNGFDLGTDYHRYTPISIEQVEWFANAMQYWDKNVQSDEVKPERN